MTAATIAAHTPEGRMFPGYFNATRQDDGSVTITIRSAPEVVHGVAVCGRDCRPGTARCNNYCNHDTTRVMARRPIDMEHTKCGPLAAFTVPADAWEQIVQDAASELIERGLTFESRSGQPSEA